MVKAHCTIKEGHKVEAGEVIFSTRRKIEGADNRSLEDAVYAFGFGTNCSYVKDVYKRQYLYYPSFCKIMAV